MYVGRIVAVGKARGPFVAYRVSSRSFPNRVARVTEAGAAIEPVDPEDIKKNPYISYNCIRVSSNGVVVSNGSHTDGIYQKLEEGTPPDVALQQVLSEMGYERDDYNTPRIAGIIDNEGNGFLATVRIDGLDIAAFPLEDNSCRFICTYEIDRPQNRSHPFAANCALDAARFVVDGGVFAEFEQPVCAAAWMDGLAVYNPHA